MLSSEPALLPALGRRLVPSARAWPAAGTLALLGLAHLPLLAIQARLTWGHPHYRFFPLVLLGAGWLAARDGGRLGPLVPGSDRRAAGILWGCWTLLAGACLISSAWLGTISAMLAAVSVAYALGSARLLRALLPAWGLLWLAIPPPLRLDDELIRLLQATATRWSSCVLDLLDVFHLREGNVIRLADRSLLIEEACSGIHSLFAVLAGTFFLMLWTPRSLVRGLILIAAAVFWVFLGNVLRIVVVVYSAAHWKVDLLAGWRHEALGLAVFALAIGLTASTDSFISFLSGLAHLRRLWVRELLIGSMPEPAPLSDTAPIPEPTQLPDLRRTGFASWPLAAAYGALILAQPFLIGNLLEDNFLPMTVAASRLLTLRASDLPASSGQFEQEQFQTVRRETRHGLGPFSRSWTYRWGKRKVMVSLDGPFQGWRELTQCYNALGWTTREQSVEPGGVRNGAFVTVRLDRPMGQKGNLFFSHFDEHGNILEPNRFGIRLGPISEFRAYGWGQLRRRTYQCQLFEEGTVPMTPAERGQALAFFERVRSQLLERIGRGGREVSP